MRVEALCWSCMKSGKSKCSWDRSLIPVDGWKAEERPYPGANIAPNRTFLVIECPLYEKDENYYVEKAGAKRIILQSAAEENGENARVRDRL